jgi:hypothetical protein
MKNRFLLKKGAKFMLGFSIFNDNGQKISVDNVNNWILSAKSQLTGDAYSWDDVIFCQNDVCKIELSPDKTEILNEGLMDWELLGDDVYFFGFQTINEKLIKKINDES